jgi:cytoskeletal protein RodZ
MPEIGDQLRETRMRNRIDITEVEAATKIRAKYLRALENEEWELLPGPTFVKTFLRTYADYLGLDARNLVEAYRARYERPSGSELTPFGTNLGGRRTRPRRPVIAPWMLVVVGVIALIAVLFVIGRWGGDSPSDEQAAQPTPTPAPAGGDKKKEKKQEKKAAAPTRVRFQIQPTGPVSVCLESGAGKVLIGNLTLDTGGDSEVFRGKRFLVSFGTPAAVMRVDGKQYQVSSDAPVGYEIRPGKRPARLPETERPTCSG